MTQRRLSESQRGFTLIELLVVVLIIGILAAIAVPQYFKVVEKGRFAEASACFSTIKGSQERYLLKYSAYTNDGSKLDVNCPAMKAYSAPNMSVAAGAYTVTIQRNATPPTYGQYTVSYVGPVGNFSCSVEACTTDLLP